jgi:hypothetical protein
MSETMSASVDARPVSYFRERWAGRISFHQLFWWEMFGVATLGNASVSLFSLILLTQGVTGGIWLALHMIVLPYNVFLVMAIWRHQHASLVARWVALLWLGATLLV